VRYPSIRLSVGMIKYGPDSGSWSYHVSRHLAPGWHAAPYVSGTCAHGDDALAAGLVALRRVRRRGF
jgi:hypothetical protein